MLKIDFENLILALFDSSFWPFNKSHEKINAIYVISAIMASIWNVVYQILLTWWKTYFHIPTYEKKWMYRYFSRPQDFIKKYFGRQ